GLDRSFPGSRARWARSSGGTLFWAVRVGRGRGGHDYFSPEVEKPATKPRWANRRSKSTVLIFAPMACSMAAMTLSSNSLATVITVLTRQWEGQPDAIERANADTTILHRMGRPD